LAYVLFLIKLKETAGGVYLLQRWRPPARSPRGRPDGIKAFTFGTIYLCPNFHNLFSNAYPKYVLSTFFQDRLPLYTPHSFSPSLPRWERGKMGGVRGRGSPTIFLYNKKEKVGDLYRS
jgi:hypothetical protein